MIVYRNVADGNGIVREDGRTSRDASVPDELVEKTSRAAPGSAALDIRSREEVAAKS